MKKLANRTLANTVIARVLRVAFTNQEWEVWRLANDEKMKFPDIGRQLGMDPEDAHASYVRIKQYMADQAEATQRAKEKRPEMYERTKGEKPVPQEGPQHYETSSSFADYTKSIELTKMMAVQFTAEGVLDSVREALKGSDPAAALKNLESQVQTLVNNAKSKMQSLRSEAAKEQQAKGKAAGFDPKKAASLMAAVKKTSKPDARQAMAALLAQAKAKL